MTAYRFCRTDDIPLLVEAWQHAFAPHFPELPALDPAGFKRWIRDLDLWCSSCMVASDGAEPIGVLLGAKRPTETLLLAIGMHPDHLRRGHGRHLLQSLGSKLAILGPPRIVAEVRASDARSSAFFEACGYTCEARMADFHLAPVDPAQAPPASAFVAVTLEDLLASDALDAAAPRCWRRQIAALRRRTDGMQGLAFASPDRVEAWALWRDFDDARDVLGLGMADGGVATQALGLLARRLAADGRPAVFDRVREDEASWAGLEAAGFTRGDEWRTYVGRAQAA